MPRIAQTQIAMQQPFINDCLADENAACPTKADEWEQASGNDYSATTGRDSPREHCRDRDQNTRAHTGNNESDNEPDEQDYW